MAGKRITDLDQSTIEERKEDGWIAVANSDTSYKVPLSDFPEVALSGDYEDLENKPTLGTAAAKNVPASGNASTTQVVMGSDSRLSNARPASDVFSWAKAATKPTYTASEVGAAATSHKHSADDITSGKLAVARGGTGQDTLQKAGNAIINALPVESVDPVDNDYFISQQANGGTTNTGFYRRKLSALWNWILSKLSSSSARQASNGSSIGNRWVHVFVNPDGTITSSDLSLQDNLYTSGSGTASFNNQALNNGTWKVAFAINTSDLTYNVPYSIWGGARGAVITNNGATTYTVYQSNGTTFTLGPGAKFSTHSIDNVHNGAALVVRFATTGIYYCPCY